MISHSSVPGSVSASCHSHASPTAGSKCNRSEMASPKKVQEWNDGKSQKLNKPIFQWLDKAGTKKIETG